MAIDIPDDPAPNGYEPFPYDTEIEHGLEYLRRETESTEGWQDIGSKEGIKMEKKTIQGDGPIPLVRGQGKIQGVVPAEFFGIISQTGARKHWDARFQEGNPLVRYSRRAYKFYSVQKGAFLVQPRDFVGVQQAFVNSDGSIELVQTSVPNDEKTGPVSGKVRGTLTVAGWTLRPDGEDTIATYIVKVNPNGSLPTAIVNKVVSEIPLCVVNAFHFYKTFGSVSRIEPEQLSSTLRIESYTHDKRQYTTAFIGKAGDEFDIIVDDRVMYKNGYELDIDGEAEGVEVEESSDKIKIKVGSAADGKKFGLVLKAK